MKKGSRHHTLEDRDVHADAQKEKDSRHTRLFAKQPLSYQHMHIYNIILDAPVTLGKAPMRYVHYIYNTGSPHYSLQQSSTSIPISHTSQTIPTDSLTYYFIILSFHLLVALTSICTHLYLSSITSYYYIFYFGIPFLFIPLHNNISNLDLFSPKIIPFFHHIIMTRIISQRNIYSFIYYKQNSQNIIFNIFKILFKFPDHYILPSFIEIWSSNLQPYLNLWNYKGSMVEVLADKLQLLLDPKFKMDQYIGDLTFFSY